MATSDLEKAGQEGARYAGLPPAAVKAKSYATWTRDFVTWLYGSQSLSLLRSPSTRLVSVPGEAERDFRLRLQQAARETRDAAVERLRLKYAPKIAVLQERRRRAEQVKEREGDQARQQQVQTAISFGATLLGAISGRKAISASTIGRATTAARGVSRSLKAQQDVARAADTVEAVDQMIADLDAQFKVEADGLSSTVDPLTESLETISIRPKKAAISVQLVALAWAPYWVDEQGSAQAAY
jgi:hypothetical protein